MDVNDDHRKSRDVQVRFRLGCKRMMTTAYDVAGVRMDERQVEGTLGRLQEDNENRVKNCMVG